MSNEMDNIGSYTGRVIRTENKQNSKNSSEKAKKPKNSSTFSNTTLEEAINQNLLKPGMMVSFSENSEKSFKFDEEILGKKQEAVFKMSDVGILGKDKAENWYIAAVLGAKIEKPLIFNGRLGRANAYDCVCEIMRSFNCELLKEEDFINLATCNYLTAEYISAVMEKMKKIFEDILVETNRSSKLGKVEGIETITFDGLNLGPGREAKFYYMAIKIQLKDINFQISNCSSSKDINYLNNFTNNPYDKFIKIGELI